MDDLISRQAAIDIVKHECGEWKGLAKEIVSQFNGLAPVQPKYNANEWCHDCSEYDHDKHCCHRYNKVIRNAVEEIKQQSCEDAISREDAIMCMTGEYVADMTYKPEDIISKHIKRLRALPSVQPERTCVNCGRTVNNGGWYADGGTRCPIEEHYALPKDGFCHLWEKRNVTDDDYPERRTDE